MEFLLLWADELDDALGALRHLAPRIVGFIVALLAFAGTGLALTVASQPTLIVLACALSALLAEAVRRRLRMAASDRDS